jgi:hypothetical protein
MNIAPPPRPTPIETPKRAAVMKRTPLQAPDAWRVTGTRVSVRRTTPRPAGGRPCAGVVLGGDVEVAVAVIGAAYARGSVRPVA